MKSQVSKCQKFGYGCMVTQVASTASGMKALLDSGVCSVCVLYVACMMVYCVYERVCVCVCVRACVRARACVCACVRACVSACII